MSPGGSLPPGMKTSDPAEPEVVGTGSSHFVRHWGGCEKGLLLPNPLAPAPVFLAVTGTMPSIGPWLRASTTRALLDPPVSSQPCEPQPVITRRLPPSAAAYCSRPLRAHHLLINPTGTYCRWLHLRPWELSSLPSWEVRSQDLSLGGYLCATAHPAHSTFDGTPTHTHNLLTWPWVTRAQR